MSFFGTHAVLIFFLLSGYLITQSCAANIKRNGFFNPAEYLASRLARIYPPLIGSILVAISVWIVIQSFGLPGGINNPIGIPEDILVVRRFFTIQLGDVTDALLMNGGMLNENGALWSLYIEFRIYVIVLFLAYGVAGRGKIWRIISLSIGATIAIYSNRFSDGSYYETYYFVWLLGAVAYLCQAHMGLNWPKFAIGGLLTAIVSMAVCHPDVLNVENGSVLIREGMKILFSLLYILLISFTPTLKISNVHIAKASKRCANFSYSLYVVHFPLLILGMSVFQGIIKTSLILSIGVAIAIGIGVIYFASYFARFFEDRRIFQPLIQKVLPK